MKVGIYSRFSTDRQTESSIADQVRVCTEYARAEGWTVAATFDDQGISGAALGNRPGVLKLQEAALARRLDAVLVTDLSRLSRSQGDLSKLIDRIVAKGVRIIGVQDGYDSARRGHKMQAGLSGIIGEAFREMIKDRTYAALESRAKGKKPTGGRAYGYRDTGIVESEAAVVREIFTRFADGMSCRSIAAELNRRHVASPGSSWNRTTRRAKGWMGSGVRVIVRNERYVGTVHWNVSEWRKDPDTGKRQRVMRPKSEWITHIDDALRIVSPEQWARAQARIETTTANGNWAAPKGRAKFLLSGLLRCASCGAHFVMANGSEYSCSGYVNGRACDNHVRVGRLSLEGDILTPIYGDMLTPQRIAIMENEMTEYYRQQMRAVQTQAAEAPHELRALDARIERLQERLKRGDEDMASDEIEAAIERAQEKRAQLAPQLVPPRGASLRVFSILPRAAEMFRKQVTAGLDGNAKEALKAREVLRQMFDGQVDLKREGESLWAEYTVQPAALLHVIPVGNRGSGGRI
ncbi:MAG: pinR [Gammaproteobacteria bacterium]|nr:pinR [Gammaproteobacteria bacterium]